MAKRRRRRRSASEIILWIMSLLVILSMVLGYVLASAPPPQPTPEPIFTPIPTGSPTWQPAVTPTTRPPTSTPAAVQPTATMTSTGDLSPTATRPATDTVSLVPTSTRPPPLTPPPEPVPLSLGTQDDFTFAVAGDNRGGDAIWQQILERVESDGSAFLISTGDLVHTGQASEFIAFRELMSGFSLPFFPVPGNHDAAGGELDAFLKYSGAPDRHYSFDFGQVHFTLADSHSGHLSQDELAWIAADLSASAQPVKMVFLHHPPFDPDGTSHILGGGNQAFMDLMEQQAVAYVFSGHIHAYAQEERNGTMYIITGGGGTLLYAVQHPQGGFHHYVRVTVREQQVTTKVIRIPSR